MAEYHGKHYDPDFICQDDYEWLTDTGRYTLAGSKTCEVCQEEPALYNIDFTTATGYDGKLTCPACTDLLKEHHPCGVVIPLLTREEAIANEACNNSPCPHRDDYEWSADPDQEISQRAVFIRYCLNKQCDAVLNAKRHVDDALRVALWEVPYTVTILALEAVQEALSQQLANLCTRIALISTYPHTGYTQLFAPKSPPTIEYDHERDCFAVPFPDGRLLCTTTENFLKALNMMPLDVLDDPANWLPYVDGKTVWIEVQS